MDKKTGLIIGILIAAVGVLIGVSVWQSKSSRANYDQYDHQSIIAANEDSGNLPENIEGNPNAPVIIYEYGDYQCTACAPTNPYINQLKEEYGDNLAIVFRTTIMSYHQNGTAAAAAANAAAKQGFWKEYKDILFKNQNDWYYSDADKRQEQFETYFNQVSEGKGNLEQFRKDMAGTDVLKKIDFDEAMAKKAGIEFTPTFYVEDTFVGQRKEDNDGKDITTEQFLDKLRAEIDKRLEAKGIKNDAKKTDSKTDTKKSS